MPDTRLILHIKGTESGTAELLREEVRAGVWEGKFSESQLIWRPSENAWKSVRELPELIPPVEKLILHVKGTEAETRYLPRPVVRAGISRGEITHSQLIWRPDENAWKAVRELPDLLPSQRLAPAPVAVKVRVAPAPEPAEEIIPESPTGPVARVVDAADAIPRVKVAVAATPKVAVAQPRVAIAVPVVARVEEAPVAEPEPVIATPKVAVAQPRVAVPVVARAEEAPVAEPKPIAVMPKVAVAQPRVAVAVPMPQAATPTPAESAPIHAAAGAPPKIRIPSVATPVVAAAAPVEELRAVEPEVAKPSPVVAMARPTVAVARPVVAAVPVAKAAVAIAPNPVTLITPASTPITPLAEPLALAPVPAAPAPMPVAPAPQPLFKFAVTPPETAPAPKTTKASFKVKEKQEMHFAKWVCIGLGALIAVLVGGNYFFVSRPLASGLGKSEFSSVSAFAHLAAFVQPNVIVIHVRPSEGITDENFTKFLVALAHNTPTNPISNVGFNRVALTSAWTADYSFSGHAWHELSDMGAESETVRKEFIMDQLASASGEPLMPQSNLNGEAQAAKREKIWNAFMHSFMKKP